MQDSDMEARALKLAEYILERHCTVRATAQHFGVSKSTVHKDLTERLRYMDIGLFKQVRILLEKNKQERHIRGGMATKRKYETKKTCR